MKRVILFYILAACSYSYGQMIMIDQPVKAGELWCYPLSTDSNSYKYLSSDIDISMVNGKPEFSYLRYDFEKEAQYDDKPEGGAILHFLIKYNTPDQKVRAAEKALQDFKMNNKIKLVGPVVFDKAEYTLISSIVKDEGVKASMLANGLAPVFENSKIPFSFKLPPDVSSVLLESFKMNTSDISIVFSLSFSGLSNDFEGTMVVDWEKLYRSDETSTSVSGNYMNIISATAGLKTAVEKMKTTNSITLYQKGSNKAMETLMGSLYSKVVDILFDRTEAPPPASNAENNSNPATEMLNNALKSYNENNKDKAPEKDKYGKPTGGESSGGGAPPAAVSVNFTYSIRKVKNSGKSTFNIKSDTKVSLYHILTLNLNSMYKKYGNDKNIFKDVKIDDPFFKEKQISIMPDITLIEQLKANKMVGDVTVTVRKKHENGEVTTKVVGINSKTLTQFDKPVYVSYGNKGDKDNIQWHKYEYMYTVTLAGQGKYETGWIPSNAFQININAPYTTQKKCLSGNLEDLKAKGVKTVDVKMTFVNWKEDVKFLSVNILKGESPFDQCTDVNLKEGEFGVNYTIIYSMTDGPNKERKGTTEGKDIDIDLQ